MAAQILNVDIKSKDDIYYRYKMPAILTKVEGSGNGIKTVFPNIRDVCVKLNRPPQVLNKFFGQELGAQSTFIEGDDKFLVMGSHDRARIQDRVYDFINRLVLCKGCRNPETDPRVTKGKLLLHCRSCGKDTDVTSERIASFYLILLQTEADAAKKSKKDAKPAGAIGAAGAEVVIDAPAAAAAATAAAATAATAEGDPIVEVPKKPLKPQSIETKTESISRENPITALANLMHQSPPVATDKVVKTLITVKTESNLGDDFTPRLLWRGAIEGIDKSKFIGAAQQWAAVFRQLVNREELQAVLMKEIAQTCEKYGPEKFPMVLKMFWEEGVLPEAEILKFVNEFKAGKTVKNAAVVDTLKAKAKPFLVWLSGEEETQG